MPLGESQGLNRLQGGSNMEGKGKKTLAILKAETLRELVDSINARNANNSTNNILKDDILSILKENGVFILLYYK